MVKFKLIGDGRFFDNASGILYTSEDGVINVSNVTREDVQKLVDMGIAEFVEDKPVKTKNNK